MVKKQAITGSSDLAILADVAQHDDALQDGVQRQHLHDDGKGEETSLRDWDISAACICNVSNACRGFKGGEVL